MPSVPAFCLNDPSDLFINFASFETGVFAFECCLSNLMSAAVYGLRVGLFFVALANLLSSNWMARHIIFGLVSKRNDFPTFSVRSRSVLIFMAMGYNFPATVENFSVVSPVRIKARALTREQIRHTLRTRPSSQPAPRPTRRVR